MTTAALSDIPAQKRVLRAAILAQRRAFPHRAEASRVIAEKIAALSEFQNAAILAAFAPMPEEVDITPLLQSALRDGKTLLLPRIVHFASGKLTFHHATNLTKLIRGKTGIAEPDPQWPIMSAAQADFFLIPAVAADHENYRLGYGGGFYDRVLAQLPPRAKTCCPLFSLQKKKKIPRELHDRPIWCIITEAD